MSEDVDDRIADLEEQLDTLQRNTVNSRGLEMAALKQLVWGLADGKPEDYDLLVDGVHSALDNADALRARVAELEELVDPDPGSTEYAQLTRPQKVHRLRRHLVTVAANTNGRASMFYDDVQSHFGGHPSPAHCYDLMSRAAELDGFAYDQAGGGQGQKRIRVNTGDVNDESLIHAAKKATGEEAG